MKPPLPWLAALALLGALVLCAQRWGYETGRSACGAQLAASRAELAHASRTLAALREEGRRRLVRSTQAQAAAHAGQVDAQAQAARILALVPESGTAGDPCRAAEALIASEMP